MSEGNLVLGISAIIVGILIVWVLYKTLMSRPSVDPYRWFVTQIDHETIVESNNVPSAGKVSKITNRAISEKFTSEDFGKWCIFRDTIHGREYSGPYLTKRTAKYERNRLNGWDDM